VVLEMAVKGNTSW